MQKSVKQKIKQVLWSFIVCFLTICAVNYWGNGFQLFGLPNQNDIVSVTISDTRLSDTERQITDAHKLLTARNAANLIHYKFGDTTGLEAPYVTITYHLANGEERVLQASNEMVIWQEKAHRLEDDSMFVRIVEVFFFGDLLEE